MRLRTAIIQKVLVSDDSKAGVGKEITRIDASVITDGEEGGDICNKLRFEKWSYGRR
jgi:hypothetical protein